MGPTFVIMYGTALHVVITGALIGGIFMPPFANWVARGLPSHQHPYIGCVVSMFVCCIVMISVFNCVPGFGVKL
jgi:Na+/melibiose symporter-like transporter